MAAPKDLIESEIKKLLDIIEKQCERFKVKEDSSTKIKINNKEITNGVEQDA